MIGKIKGYVHKYEKYITPTALVGGFILDSLTLRRVDFLAENILLMSYLVLVFLGVALLRYADITGTLKFRTAIFAMTQFALGGLFSAFTVFYARSGSWVASWPFLLLLLAFMVSAEFMKKYYAKFLVQVIVAYLALFSYLIFSIPLLTKTIGPWTFIFSGALSLALMWLYTKYIGKKLVGDPLMHSLRTWLGIALAYVCIVFFYFAHIIPPIPLSLAESKASSYISKSGTEYVFADIRERWYGPDVVDIAEGSPVYFYSSVFSPTHLDTHIIHDWQYYDESAARWESVSRIRFPIVGGRNEGYRGYSVKSNIYEGSWRVDVETEYGQLIGRARFDVLYK